MPTPQEPLADEPSDDEKGWRVGLTTRRTAESIHMEIYGQSAYPFERAVLAPERISLEIRHDGEPVLTLNDAQTYALSVPGIERFQQTLNTTEVAQATLARAKFVAEHWRDSIMGGLPSAHWAAHPLAMVLAALDGETDPVECGINEEAHEAFRAIAAPQPRALAIRGTALESAAAGERVTVAIGGAGQWLLRAAEPIDAGTVVALGADGESVRPWTP